jgi:acylphosphatase
VGAKVILMQVHAGFGWHWFKKFDIMKTLHILVKGKVQGVFFRASAKEKAVELNLSGWVKNTAEGDVEAMVTGEESALNAFVAWCHSGPSRANVTTVEVTTVNTVHYSSFTIERGRQ